MDHHHPCDKMKMLALFFNKNRQFSGVVVRRPRSLLRHRLRPSFPRRLDRLLRRRCHLCSLFWFCSQRQLTCKRAPARAQELRFYVWIPLFITYTHSNGNESTRAATVSDTDQHISYCRRGGPYRAARRDLVSSTFSDCCSRLIDVCGEEGRGNSRGIHCSPAERCSNFTNGFCSTFNTLSTF